jgi:ATP-dependent DNA helicase DinG
MDRVTAALPGGGEDRPGQRQMARAVARSIDTGRHLVVQAGTGTGKSLAYLVPAILSGRRVVVATATKALQDQLATRDLPLLQRALEVDFGFVVLKGRSNYLCRQRLGEVTSSREQGELSEARATGLEDEVRRLVAWAGHSTTGDRAELSFEPSPQAWGLLSVGAHECPGRSRCPAGHDCFAELARERAADASVVVTNMHLYAAHLANDAPVLPPHDIVVFDEAHELEDIATASLGLEIGAAQLRSLARAARPLLERERSGLASDLEAAGDRLDETLSPWAGRRLSPHQLPSRVGPANWGGPATGQSPSPTGQSPSPTGQSPSPTGQSPSPTGQSPSPTGDSPSPTGDSPSPTGDDALVQAIELTTERLARLTSALRHPLGAQGSLAINMEATSGALADPSRARTLQAAGKLAADLAKLGCLGANDVAWVEERRTHLAVRVAPIEIGSTLAECLWGEVTAILTSATVPLGLANRLGIPQANLDTTDVGSPFPYPTHALLYCAAALPDRRHPQADRALHEELVSLINAAGGRTLALFTSWRGMIAAAHAVGPKVPFRVLTQDELPKTALLAAFAKDESVCLFATMGFWQGVDVPGPTLSLVAIDRIPFPRPDDPLLCARRERAGAAAFRTIDLPRASMLLAQGAGRLIRSNSDRGVVAVLDRRLAYASYRWDLVRALPPMTRTRHRSEVNRFLAEALGPPSYRGPNCEGGR